MFRAIGSVIILYAVVHIFSAATAAFETAVVASFQFVETAAEIGEAALVEYVP